LDDRIPLPEDARTALLAGIFILLGFYTIYFAREIVMPIVFALLLNLLLQPLMRFLAKLRIPITLGALLAIALLLGIFVMLISTLAGPAADWARKLPQSLSHLQERLWYLRAPLTRLQGASAELSHLAAPQNGATPVVIEGSGLGGLLFTGTRDVLAGIITSVVVLFFLLMSGDLFLRKLVEVLPRFRDKKRAVAVSQEVERNISAYLLTISAMNLMVGIGVGIASWLYGLDSPLMWGALAFLLNYIPILGPLLGVALVALAGALAFDSLWRAAFLGGTYLAIHFLEGEVVTPMLVARRFTLNPVLVIISLIFWYWLWGVPGAIMAVPLLATAKIICDHVRPLMALGHFLGS